MSRRAGRVGPSVQLERLSAEKAAQQLRTERELESVRAVGRVRGCSCSAGAETPPRAQAWLRGCGINCLAAGLWDQLRYMAQPGSVGPRGVSITVIATTLCARRS